MIGEPTKQGCVFSWNCGVEMHIIYGLEQLWTTWDIGNIAWSQIRNQKQAQHITREWVRCGLLWDPTSQKKRIKRRTPLNMILKWENDTRTEVFTTHSCLMVPQSVCPAPYPACSASPWLITQEFFIFSSPSTEDNQFVCKRQQSGLSWKLHRHVVTKLTISSSLAALRSSQGFI